MGDADRSPGGDADRSPGGDPDRSLECYSTVTVFARLRGWSTSSPRVVATW